MKNEKNSWYPVTIGPRREYPSNLWENYRTTPEGFEVNDFNRASTITSFTYVHRVLGTVLILIHSRIFNLYFVIGCKCCRRYRDLKQTAYKKHIEHLCNYFGGFL